MNITLTGKRVLVTGGNSGLGAAIAETFAAEGAAVAINYVVNPDEAEALVNQFTTAGGRALGLMADISYPKAVAAMFAAFDKAWGGIDILMNNAGADGHAAFGWEADADAWGKVIDINLKGAFLGAREALERMVPQKSGVIINTSSVHKVIAWSGYSDYTASKAGVSMMSKSLAQEAGPHGVRELCIAPGAIKTPINRQVWDNPESYQDLLARTPLGRIGEPDDVARMAVMLASDVGRYVTATTVFIDGGTMAKVQPIAASNFDDLSTACTNEAASDPFECAVRVIAAALQRPAVATDMAWRTG